MKTQIDNAACSSLFHQKAVSSDGLNVQLNKGHFSLDTPERSETFSKKLSSGWEQDYADYRRLWTDLPVTKTIRDYPLLIDLELSSVCNLSCPMCYTITDEFRKKVTKGYMEYDLFQKIIDEIKGKVYAVRLSLRGEATLHKRFIECIRYCKDAGIKEVSTLTNGSRLEGTYLEQMIDAGIDWITVSVDGTGETYENIRKPMKFDQICRNLESIRTYKQKKNLVKPVVKVQGIWPAIRKNPELYYNTFVSLSDLVAFNPLIDYLRKDQDIVYEENFSCPQLYQRLVVGSDGKIMMCSNDEDGLHIVGDAYTQTIHQVWHGNELRNVREIHARHDGFKELPVCRHCYYPRKAVPDETAMVNGRHIIIENYVNRAQQVGK